MESKPLTFSVKAEHGLSRVADMSLPHSSFQTPIFMPVATNGAYKGLTSDDLEEIGADIILGNTYHLASRPGSDVVEHFGGLHEFCKWRRNILTDSGGFQIVSLSDLVEIKEEGVRFSHPKDGKTMLLTPEKSIEHQNRIGSDIMMQLDDVVMATLDDKDRVEEAMGRTLRWLDRCIVSNKNPDRQVVFGIVQGGLHEDLRRTCIQEMTKRNLHGYAIGGLSGGEEKDMFWRIVKLCTSLLPRDKPRYLMGVGYPVDIVLCVAMGIDMFDCVYIARTARFGSAVTSSGEIRLSNSKYGTDLRPLDPSCSCKVCNGDSTYTRSFFHRCRKEEHAIQLLTYHNVYFVVDLMRRLRAALLDGTFRDFVYLFMERFHGSRENFPDWLVNALTDLNLLRPADE